MANNFVSQYKNLFHHFVHQDASGTATSFWAGCGAIRRDIFLRLGGFNTAYKRPSIEDIELGYRLTRAGHRIVAQCEADAFRRRVLARHWPGVPCFHDIREVASGDGPRGSGEVAGNRPAVRRLIALTGGTDGYPVIRAGK